MLQFILNTLDFCTALLAWSLFSIALFSLLWQGRMGKEWAMALIWKKRVFIFCFCIIVLLNLLTTSPIPGLLINIFVILLSGYVFHQSYLHQVIKRKVGSYLISYFRPTSSERTASGSGSVNTLFGYREGAEEEVEITVVFPEEKIKQIHRVLDTPDYLYNPDLSINLLAQEVGVNTTYLSRYFNRQLGISFPEYVTSRRLDKAEELLRDTDMRVVDIFEHVGFQNPSTFYLVFSERHRLSPLQWRESMKSS